jgi:hypothetical protein
MEKAAFKRKSAWKLMPSSYCNVTVGFRSPLWREVSLPAKDCCKDLMTYAQYRGWPHASWHLSFPLSCEGLSASSLPFSLPFASFPKDYCKSIILEGP